MQHLLIQCIILQSLYRSTTQSIILPANSPFSIQTEVRVPTECGAYNKLIQCYSIIQCNTWQYNVALPNTLYRSHNKIVFLPAKHKVFRTFLAPSWSECGAYNKLIQFYSVIQCNTWQYNVAFPNTLYRSHNQIVFFPAKHTVFRTILGRFSTECGAYNKLIQCYSLIQCNTWQYNVAFPNTLYRSHNQIVFFPAKHTVFRTILGRFSTEWQRYMK